MAGTVVTLASRAMATRFEIVLVGEDEVGARVASHRQSRPSHRIAGSRSRSVLNRDGYVVGRQELREVDHGVREQSKMPARAKLARAIASPGL